MDPACSGEHSRNERLLDTIAGVCLTILLVLGFGCVLQQRLALAPKLSIEGYVDSVAISCTMVTSRTRSACPATWKRWISMSPR